MQKFSDVLQTLDDASNVARIELYNQDAAQQASLKTNQAAKVQSRCIAI